MGLVITDHHECKNGIPEADAVVDPKRPDCPYPNKHLAGVGVAFKLVCALSRLDAAQAGGGAPHSGGLGKTPPGRGDATGDAIAGADGNAIAGADETMLAMYSDLVATGTIADGMPGVGENRELIKRGLRIINEGKSPRPGIRRLLREAFDARGKASAGDIGYILAPFLNAAGRVGRSEVSVELLLSEDAAVVERIALELDELNNERRKLAAQIYEEAAEMLENEGYDRIIVLAKHGWHQGVSGIVASRIADRFFAPAIVISVDDDGVGRGSCRSYGGFPLYDALRSCADILLNYGGHEKAAGVTIAEENIDELRDRLDEFCHEESVEQKASLKLDFEVEKPELLTVANVEALGSLEPFGPGNTQPNLCIADARLAVLQSVGSGKHTRLVVEKSGRTLDCIFFSMPTSELRLKEGMRVDVAFEPRINEFRGNTSVQLQVLDIRKAKP
jgi:single-stranded-DNA-specific exonuclease